MTGESSHRTAIITGASRGLGLALARRLAEDGWALIIDARGEEALDNARAELSNHTQVIAIPGDVADRGHRAAISEAAHEAGGVDALVNNASILGPSPQPDLLDYPLDVLEEVYRKNVISPLALIQDLRTELKPAGAHYQRHERRRRRAVRRLGRIRVEQGRAGTALQHPRSREPGPARLPCRSRRHAYQDAAGSLPRRGYQRPPAPRRERARLPRAPDGRPAERTLRGPRAGHQGGHDRRGLLEGEGQIVQHDYSSIGTHRHFRRLSRGDIPASLRAASGAGGRRTARGARTAPRRSPPDGLLPGRRQRRPLQVRRPPRVPQSRRHPRRQHQRHHERRTPRRARGRHAHYRAPLDPPAGGPVGRRAEIILPAMNLCSTVSQERS